MRDETGESVAPFDLWRASMMANSARDPIWRAMVSTEVAATPSRKAEIGAKCTRCHAPMASVEKSHAENTLALAELYDRRFATCGSYSTPPHRSRSSSLTPNPWSSPGREPGVELPLQNRTLDGGNT